MTRTEKSTLLSIEKFLSDKKSLSLDIKPFQRVFKSYKVYSKKSNNIYENSDVYVLDNLTINQKQSFREYYSYALRGAGTLFSEKFCGDNVYRNEYRFKEVLILIG